MTESIFSTSSRVCALLGAALLVSCAGYDYRNVVDHARREVTSRASGLDVVYLTSGAGHVYDVIVRCGAPVTFATVWGTDHYDMESNVCAAAVHAGAIVASEGGDVRLIVRDFDGTFVGSWRNGMLTSSGPRSPRSRSFHFVPLEGTRDAAALGGETHREHVRDPRAFFSAESRECLTVGDGTWELVRDERAAMRSASSEPGREAGRDWERYQRAYTAYEESHARRLAAIRTVTSTLDSAAVTEAPPASTLASGEEERADESQVQVASTPQGSPASPRSPGTPSSDSVAFSSDLRQFCAEPGAASLTTTINLVLAGLSSELEDARQSGRDVSDHQVFSFAAGRVVEPQQATLRGFTPFMERYQSLVNTVSSEHRNHCGASSRAAYSHSGRDPWDWCRPNFTNSFGTCMQALEEALQIINTVVSPTQPCLCAPFH